MFSLFAVGTAGHNLLFRRLVQDTQPRYSHFKRCDKGSVYMDEKCAPLPLSTPMLCPVSSPCSRLYLISFFLVSFLRLPALPPPPSSPAGYFLRVRVFPQRLR